MNNTKKMHFPYRADIDGIRAVAVVLVLLFHAFPEYLKGGFLGVDIFFVISGYLITSIVLGDLKNGTYTLKDFYIKRINRIFPALLIVLIFSMILGWFGLNPYEYKELGRHGASAAFFVSNLTLWMQSGYFDTSSDLKPLLHMWSLAVEEQFYIFWPLILGIIWKSRKNLLKVTFLIIVVSFGVNLFMSSKFPSGAFYSPMSRFWEILLGAYLSFLSGKVSKVKYSNLKSLLGLLLIAISIAVVTEHSFFPGFWALLPTLGTCLLISAGSKAWINHNILSSKAFVWIGLISYPLYLWHWPLFSFSRIITNGPLSSLFKISLLFVSFVLAWLTYNFLERPLRKFPNKIFNSKILLSMLIVVGIFGTFVKSQKGFLDRDYSSVNNYPILSSGFKGENTAFCKEFGLKMKTSIYCSKYSDSNILIVGDSHSAHLYYGFKNNQDIFFNKVSVLGAVGCNGLLNYYEDDNCIHYIDTILKTLDINPKIKFVVLTGSHQIIEGLSGFQSEKYVEGYSAMIKELVKRNITPVFFVDNKALLNDPLRCIKSKLPLRRYFAQIPSFCESLKDEHTSSHFNYDIFVSKLFRRFPDVLFYDPRSLICKNGTCSLFRDGKLLYSDINHYSIYGSLLVVDDFIDSLNKVK